jgi:addiction module HigA family antidote
MARTPIHPGEISRRRTGGDRTVGEKARRGIAVPPNRLCRLLAGKRNVTADGALRLSRYFGMSADFWMNLQGAYKLDLARKQSGKTIARIPKRGERAEPSPRKGPSWLRNGRARERASRTRIYQTMTCCSRRLDRYGERVIAARQHWASRGTPSRLGKSRRVSQHGKTCQTVS